MGNHKVYTTKDIENYVIEGKKTNATKKAAITREIKALKELKQDYETAYNERNKKDSFGWYLGNRIFQHDIKDVERSINFLEKYSLTKFPPAAAKKAPAKKKTKK